MEKSIIWSFKVWLNYKMKELEWQKVENIND